MHAVLFVSTLFFFICSRYDVARSETMHRDLLRPAGSRQWRTVRIPHLMYNAPHRDAQAVVCSIQSYSHTKSNTNKALRRYNMPLILLPLRHIAHRQVLKTKIQLKYRVNKKESNSLSQADYTVQ